MPKPTHKWLALAVTSLGTFVSCVNNSSMNIANPVLASAFGITLGQVQWTVSIYSIVICSLMILMGRLGDRVGAHRVYLCGVAVFSAGSLACACSPVFPVLLAARVLQAAGGAMMVATGMGLVASIFPIQQRGMALGINILMVGMGNFAGPTVAGLILSVASWHWVFLFNLPVAVVVMVLGLLWLRSPVPPLENPEPLDYAGSLLMALFVAALVVFLSGSVEPGWAFALAAAALLAVFVRHERHSAAPLLVMGLFGNRRFTYGNLIAFFTYAGSHMMMFLLPFFLEDVWGMPVALAGVVMVVQGAVMGIMGPASGVLSDRIGAMKIMPWAIGLYILSFCLLMFIGAEENIPHLVACLALTGLGMGLLNTPNNSEIMTSAGRENTGYASGFVGASRQLAFSVANGMGAGLFSLAYAALLPAMGDPSAYIAAFRGMSGFAVALGCVSLFLWWRTDRYLKAHPEANTGWD